MYQYYGMGMNPQVNYQPQSYQVPVEPYNYKPQAAQMPAASSDERIWVANETAANAYLVAPNGFVRLWDSQRPVFYEKTTDPTGKQFPMVTYKYERLDQEAAAVNSFDDRLKVIEERLAALESKKVKKNETKSDAANEPA